MRKPQVVETDRPDLFMLEADAGRLELQSVRFGNQNLQPLTSPFVLWINECDGQAPKVKHKAAA